VITWIVGAGGLLGRSLVRHSADSYHPGPVPWHDPKAARETLHAQARTFEAIAGTSPWRVIWAAGAATTSTPHDIAMAELLPLHGLVTGLRSALPSGSGNFFLTSSAGGVYAGSRTPPFTSTSVEAPLSPYGELKLAQESLVRESLGTLLPVVIGRISNLYGPGQNLDKLQGLISRLALAAITQQPLEVFVPLNTIRDYLHVDDAARLILELTSNPVRAPTNAPIIIATGVGTTIGQLIRMTRDVTKHRVPVALGSHPSSVAQALDLRLEPTIDLPQRTPLPAGVRDVYLDLLSRLQVRALA
jgi:UDP-glucose 4-epimerase